MYLANGWIAVAPTYMVYQGNGPNRSPSRNALQRKLSVHVVAVRRAPFQYCLHRRSRHHSVTPGLDPWVLVYVDL